MEAFWEREREKTNGFCTNLSDSGSVTIGVSG